MRALGAVFALLCSQLLPLQVLQTSMNGCVADCLYKVASDTFNLKELFYCVVSVYVCTGVCLRVYRSSDATVLWFSADHPQKLSALSSSWNRNHCKNRKNSSRECCTS